MTTPPARRLSSRELGRLDFSLHDPRVHWAKGARASSSWSDSYGPSTACGPPSVFPEHGDRSGTWLADSSDRRPWIELEMPTVERACAVLILETCSPGGITSVRDQDNAIDLYEASGKATKTLRGAQLLVVPIDPDGPVPARIRVGMKRSDEYQEIDAVALITVPFDELMTTPAQVTTLHHRRLAPIELDLHDLRGDRRIAWAKTAHASSEYSSSYSARAAIGRPNVFPKGGDIANTWLSDNGDRDAWLEVGFGDPPEGATDCYGFLVFETCGAGSVVRATDEKDRTLWQARMESVPERQARMLHVPLPPGPPPKKLRIHVSPAVSDYREIDAVALLFAPLAELATEAPPPPPPPIFGAPPEGFTMLEGTLIGVSAAAPLVHAIVRTENDARAVSFGPPLRLRMGESEIELELDSASVFGDPLLRRRGRFGDVALPALAAHVPIPPDTPVQIQGQLISEPRRVYVAGVPEGMSEGGFRERASTPSRMKVAAISTEPLSATPFLREGTRTFTAGAQKFTEEKRVPHPLAAWMQNAIGVAGIGISAALAALLLTQDGATGWGAALLSLAVSLMLGSSIFALELVGRAHTPFVVWVGASAKRNARVPFTSPGWTLFGVLFTVGLGAGFMAMALGTANEDMRWEACVLPLILAGAYALVRAPLWMWSAAPALVAALRVLFGRRATGALVASHRSTERLTAHSEFLGTEQRVDDQGRVTTHDRYRNWNARSANANHRVTIALPDGTRVRSESSVAVIDVGMRPRKDAPSPRGGPAGTPYAASDSEHEIGDVASLVGRTEASDGETRVVGATVLLGEVGALRKRTSIAGLCLVLLWAFAIAGVTVVAVGIGSDL